jgi:hypothetical protein
MEFFQAQRRFFSIRSFPAMILSDNGTNLVGALTELLYVRWSTAGIRSFTITVQKKEFNGSSQLQAHHTRMVALKPWLKAVNELWRWRLVITFSHPLNCTYTCILEVANLLNQRPIGRVPNGTDDGSYLCPNSLILGRASPRVPQWPFEETRHPRRRVTGVEKEV